MKPLSFLIPQTIFKTTSKFSGEIKVIDHVFERRMSIGGLTQSGGILKSMWEKALSEEIIKEKGAMIKKVLVLGLGAGTVAQVISKKWPNAIITGIEIDPAIIDTGKKYFQLGNVKNLEIIIDDAIEVINNETIKRLNNQTFDLIIIDLYKGFFIERNINNNSFLQKIAQKLIKNGIVIFNVLTYQNDDFEAKKFLDKLNGIFDDNFCKRIITNDFYFCTKVIHQRR